MGEGESKRQPAQPFASFIKPDVAGFALLAFFAPWLSIFSSRVLGGVLPVAALLAVAGARWARGRFPAMETGPWCFAGVVVIFCAVSSLWTADTPQSLDSTARIAGAFIGGLLLFYAAGEIDEDARARLRAIFLGSFVFGLALMLVNALTSAGVYTVATAAGSLSDAQVEANRPMVALILFVWPAVIVALRLGRPRLAMALPVLTLLISLLTESQTAQVTGALAIVVYWIARLVPRRSGALMLCGGAFVLAAMPWVLLALKAVDPQIGFNWQTASTGARLEIWYSVASEVPRALFIGHGVEAARYVQDWHMAHIYFPAGKGIQHPHNGPLQIWYEFGALGAALGIWIWVKLVQRISAMNVADRAAAFACLAAILVVSSISHGLWQSWWLGAVALCPTFLRVASSSPHEAGARA
jgi:hypothetical protein